MGKEHNNKGQLIIKDVETGEIIKFTDEEYDRYLKSRWLYSGIEPNYNFAKNIQDESTDNK